MVARVVIGKRGSDFGIWISKDGEDALTATGDDLILDMSTNQDQIMQFGTITSGSGSPGMIEGTPVALGYGVAPTVIILDTVTTFHSTTRVFSRPIASTGYGVRGRLRVTEANFTYANESFLALTTHYMAMRRAHL